ncbi:META domain-containing protein [Corynebacterium sp. J010B-136]|uniref:META domain-containing protein n=1 Tax=Corynebacterium sp. J010B-136 TaxID=2099401 RepID=UPI000CF94815|nr:META domain-containing protein [Corynebacterium sp. J010B-136]PQM75085.1 META domain-containing protein [Corynebacterium sp. J010B-136]
MNSNDFYIGTWGSSEPGQPHLVFAEGGAVSGSDGCNRLMGQWTVEDGVITFSQMASTMMYCESVDTWLRGAVTAYVQEDVLHIRDGEGAEIGTLSKDCAAGG